MANSTEHKPAGTPLAFRPEDAFAQIGIGRTSGYAELRSGRLRSMRVGKMRLVTREALVDWLAAREAEARREPA